MDYYLLSYVVFLVALYLFFSIKKPKFNNPMFYGSAIIFIAIFTLLIFFLTLLIIFGALLSLRIDAKDILDLIWSVFTGSIDIYLFVVLIIVSILLIRVGVQIIKSEKLNSYS
jgi:hypothetical protein